MMTSIRSKRFSTGLPPLGQVRAEKARRRLRDFVRWAWPVVEPATPLRWGRHLDAVCDHLEAVSRRQLRNLLVECPPGLGKSTVASVLWPAWHWVNWPADRFVTASYALKLALRDSVRSRRVIESPPYQAHFGDCFRMTGDQNVKERYENDRTGFRVTASVDGGTTGERGQFTLIDDAHNVREAESAAVRLGTIDWHDQAFFNRVNDARLGGRVVIGQRVHHDDLIGHLRRSGDWVELLLQEEYDPRERCATPIGWSDWRTEPGQLLRPEVFGPEQTAEAKRTLGSAGYLAQHQQRPVPREGAIFKTAWFEKRRFVDQGDAYRLAGGPPVLKRDCWRFVVLDPAGGESSSADFTAAGVFAVTPGCDLLLEYMLRERVPLEAIVPRLKAVCDQWRPSFAALETGFFQGKLAQQARKLAGMVPVKELHPGGKSKLVRALPAVIRAEAGQIYLPVEAPWLGDFLAELAVFVGADGGKDDQIDCLGYAAQLVQEHEGQRGGVKEVPYVFQRSRTAGM